MRPQGIAGDCPADSPSSSTATYLTERCLLFLRFQFSTAYRSSWFFRPIGAPLVSLREALHRSHRVLASPRNPQTESNG
jgi:hypothetical protein